MTTARWKEQLQQASFRGIEFKIADIETVVGRRSVTHEYPLRDVPYVEDLGKRAREFTVNAYVIGDNYIDNLQQLISAIEQDGTPGIFRHPTLGIMNVVAKEFRINFRGSEGGIEYLTITFTESGTNQYPTVKTDTVSNSKQKSAAGITQAIESFADNYALEGFSDFVSKRAKETLIGADSSLGGSVIFNKDSLSGVLNSVISKGAYFSGSRENYSTLRNKLSKFRADVPTLINTPTTLAEKIADLIESLGLVFLNQPDKIIIAMKQLFLIFGIGINEIPLTTPATPIVTPNRAQMVLNQAQLIDLVHIGALLEIVKAVADLEFESRNDAMKFLFDIQKLMEPKLTYLADNAYDLAYNALNNARIAMVLDIKSRSASLKTIKYIANYYSVPSIVLAHQQYQDATQDEDIISRNRIIHNPLFVPANKDIEILV